MLSSASFDWDQYLVLAKNLAGQAAARPGIEASQRSAISRAYYSAFCKVRNNLRDREGFMPSREADDHQRVRLHLLSMGRVTDLRRRMAIDLSRLRRRRNMADYDDHVIGLTSMTSYSIGLAESIIAQSMAL